MSDANGLYSTFTAELGQMPYALRNMSEEISLNTRYLIFLSLAGPVSNGLIARVQNNFFRPTIAPTVFSTGVLPFQTMTKEQVHAVDTFFLGGSSQKAR